MPTSQKRNTLSKNKSFAFGLKPIELRCKSGRVLIRKWAVYDTQTAHLFYAFQHAVNSNALLTQTETDTLKSLLMSPNVPSYSCHNPQAGLRHVAIVDIGGIKQVVGLYIDAVARLAPRQTCVYKRIGLISDRHTLRVGV